MELLRITRQIHCKAVEQRATLIHRQYNRDWGTSYSKPPIDQYLTSPLLQILAAPLLRGTSCTTNPQQIEIEWSYSITVGANENTCVRPRRVDCRKCGQQARPSTSFVDNTVYMRCRETSRVWDKVPVGLEVSLSLQVPAICVDYVGVRCNRDCVSLINTISRTARGLTIKAGAVKVTVRGGDTLLWRRNVFI